MSDAPLDTAREFLAQFGVTPRVVSQNKHIKIRFEYQGAKLQTSVSKTPSDHRSNLNLRSQLRRLMSAIEVRS
jgi:hypothetical protein